MIIVDDYLNEKEMQFWHELEGRNGRGFVTLRAGELLGLLIELAKERRARMDATPPAPPPGRIMEHVRR